MCQLSQAEDTRRYSKEKEMPVSENSRRPKNTRTKRPAPAVETSATSLRRRASKKKEAGKAELSVRGTEASPAEPSASERTKPAAVPSSAAASGNAHATVGAGAPPQSAV